MTKRLVLGAAFLVVTLPGAAHGQGHVKLVRLIPGLYGPSGLIVDSEALLPSGETHSAHFNSAFQSEFTQFNVALASQVAAIPLPSPASGYTYTFDPTLGVFQRSTQSFGPILADRAETIGKNKFGFGFTAQRFRFDSLEGVDLGSVPAVFTHDDFQSGGGRSDVVTTMNSIDVTVNQFSAFFTYGLTSHVDVSLAVPLVSVDMAVVSDATIQRIGTVDPRVHFFRDASGGFGSTKRFSASGAASGVGDIVLRVKAAPPRNGPTALAMAVDLRLPTGDEEDLLGVGALGIKPMMILSWSYKTASPHLNLGYQWNGRSVVGGDPTTGAKEDLPDEFLYDLGLDVGLSKKVTLAVDLLGRRVVDAPRLTSETFTAANGRTFPQISFRRGSFSATTGAVGLKVNTGGSLLLDVNLLMRIDKAGLRDKFTPLLGFEYSF